jgi:hypothetical protein
MDRRYLVRQRQGWYVRVKVPKELKAQVGKSEIVRTLQTRDLAVAQSRRWSVVSEVMREF